MYGMNLACPKVKLYGLFFTKMVIQIGVNWASTKGKKDLSTKMPFYHLKRLMMVL